MLIVATIGLNSFQEDKLRKIILSGADILRYNLSYHIIEEKLESVITAKRVIEDLNSSVKILIDLPTNKIRLGDFNERIFTVKEKDEIILRSASYSQDCNEFIPVEMGKLGEKTYVNQMITIGDGEVALQIVEIINSETIKARVLNNGAIKYMKTFNIDQRIEKELFYKYYRELLSQIKDLEIDYLAVPFISREANTVIRNIISECQKNVKIVIKIERGLDTMEINDIINDRMCSMVMLDRGELGVNEPYEKMGILQLEMIKTMRANKKPILISTQILESTVNNFIPNRAEITNLTDIVMKGADGIVLCHETTVGLRPSYTISVAKRIINEVSRLKDSVVSIPPAKIPSAKLNPFINSNLPSLTEWLEKIQSPDIVEFKREDIAKYQRLEILNRYIGIPFDKPDVLEAADVFEKSNLWLNLLEAKKDEVCAIKLIPKTADLPKFRGIGKTLKEYSESWLPMYESQIVNPREYKVEVLRHNYDMQYSSIFLINDFGIWGDLIEGVHWQLTQGVSERSPLTFYYNFQNLWFHDEESRQIENYKYLITTAIKHLLVARPQLQYSLESELQAEFTMHGYLKGYFEFFYWPERGLTYNDYNRVIYRKLNDLKLYITDAQADLKGLCANPGKVVGPARIVNDPKTEVLNTGEILVCKSINMDYLPAMTKCAGIVTEQGNILSHLAIISRELKKPCIVSVKNITKRLKNGDRIKLDADKGIIEMISIETNL